jgi:TPR repeat protein
MNRFFHFSLGWRHRLIAINLAWLLIMATMAPAADITTNWMTLEEVLKKWEPVPLGQVQQAAENGEGSAAHYLGYCYAEGLRVAKNPETGAAWYQRALKGGYLPSANNLGLLYQRGLLGSNDLGRAVYYYTYAAERGLAQSQANLGILYRDGNGLKYDPAEAMRWFRQAAGQGHPAAMVEIGRLYRFGRGVSTNLPEAIKWFEMAAEKKNPPGMFNLGLLYEDQGQPDKAVQYYRQSADLGSSDAMTQLYLCYWDGKGVAVDHDQAMAWLTKATADNNPYAECLMGYRCESVEWVGEGANRHLTKPKLLEAFQWYRRSAAQDWRGGQYHLGLCYLEGKVVELDEARGLELMRAAADKGLKDAIVDLAHLYARGVGEPRNENDRPLQLLEQAHAWGELVSRYEHGLGTPRDLVTAAHCFCKLSLENTWYYSSASLLDKIDFHSPKRFGGTPIIDPADRHVQILGSTDDNSDGPSDNVLRVLSLYLKSATGNGQAAGQIGNLYVSGIDAPISTAKAWAWFNIAARNGIAAARDKITALERQMSAEDLKTAQQQLETLNADLKEVAAVLPPNR